MRVFGLMLKAIAVTALAAAAPPAFIGTAGGAAASEPSELASFTTTAPVASPNPAVRFVADKKSSTVQEPKVTREQAVAIAQKALPGRVTSVEIEPKRGRLVYAVEIMTSQGEETDVLVDTETGEILGMEN
jgi:uncharacterized membrane protein YkoI